MAEKVDRLTRINELMKRELADLFERELLKPAHMLVSVTEVNTSVDLRNATVYISLFGGTPGEKRRVMHELENRRLGFQSTLARVLAFKRTPVLAFRPDERQERGDKVFELLNGEKPGDE